MSIADASLFSVQGLTIRFLTADDGQALQVLCEECSDHYEKATGLPPGPAEAQSLFLALPNGKDFSDKGLLGVFDDGNGKLSGVLDFCRNYPQEGDWFLGLLMLRPDQRNKGLGRQLYFAFEKWAQENGARNIRLGVVDSTPDALRFWTELGFENLHQPKAMRLGNRDAVVTILKRSV